MAKFNNVVVDILITRGAGKTYEDAKLRSRARLAHATARITVGELPDDPGVQFMTEDPGGGGGPCEPNKKLLEYTTNAGGLPEAVSHDNGDDD